MGLIVSSTGLIVSSTGRSCSNSLDFPRSGNPVLSVDSEVVCTVVVFSPFSFWMAALICLSEYPWALAAALASASDMPVFLIISFACFICSAVWADNMQTANMIIIIMFFIEIP